MSGLDNYGASFGFPSSMFRDMFEKFDFLYTASTTAPECDYVENGDELMIYVRAPGYTRDDLAVEVQDGILSVKAELPEDRRPTTLVPAKIDYEFTLGTNYKIEEASHENGILAIRTTRLKKTGSTKIPVVSRAK
jgi:HSP20 family molecular chaperone IbpA